MPRTNKAVLEDGEYISAMRRLQGAMIFACQLLASNPPSEQLQMLASILERIGNDFTMRDPVPDYLPEAGTNPLTYKLPPA